MPEALEWHLPEGKHTRELKTATGRVLFEDGHVSQRPGWSRVIELEMNLRWSWCSSEGVVR